MDDHGTLSPKTEWSILADRFGSHWLHVWVWLFVDSQSNRRARYRDVLTGFYQQYPVFTTSPRQIQYINDYLRSVLAHLAHKWQVLESVASTQMMRGYYRSEEGCNDDHPMIVWVANYAIVRNALLRELTKGTADNVVLTAALLTCVGQELYVVAEGHDAQPSATVRWICLNLQRRGAIAFDGIAWHLVDVNKRELRPESPRPIVSTTGTVPLDEYLDQFPAGRHINEFDLDQIDLAGMPINQVLTRLTIAGRIGLYPPVGGSSTGKQAAIYRWFSAKHLPMSKAAFTQIVREVSGVIERIFLDRSSDTTLRTEQLVRLVKHERRSLLHRVLPRSCDDERRYESFVVQQAVRTMIKDKRLVVAGKLWHQNRYGRGPAFGKEG